MVCFISIIYPMACLFYFICFSVSVTIPPPINARTRSCPMVLTTTVRPIPHTCIATGEAWGQGQALPSPSSLLPPPHPPPLPPAPPVHGHVPPQPCFQTTLTTARWGQWCLHHESPAGRFVHHLDLDDPSSLWTVCLTCKPHSFFLLPFFCILAKSASFKTENRS